MVSKEKGAEYDPKDFDEEQCPRCKGSGQTGLNGRECKLCKGNGFVDSERADAYRKQYE